MKKSSLQFTVSSAGYRWGMIVILALTALLRLYQLGQVPHGMTWDEAAIGYNGFAVLTTRRDEWLTRLPISFWSFGDYKAPLAIYLNGLSTWAFGMNLFAVRLPFALSGIAAVLGMMYLTRILWEKTGEGTGKTRFYSLAAGVLMMLSPWHHHFSRAGFESGMALMFYIWAIYFFFKALQVSSPRRRQLDFILFVLGLVASIYTYHSAKIVAPLIALLLFIWYRRELLTARYRQSFLRASLLGLVALGPFVYDAVFAKGLERASTLITNQGHSTAVMIRVFIAQLAAHLSASFLMLGKTTALRHGDGRWGVLLPTTLALVLFVPGHLVYRGYRQRLLGLATALLLVGLLPAALGTEVPHSNRALLALPGFLLMALLGLKAILETRLADTIKRAILGTAILLHSLFFLAYLQHYYTGFAVASARDWQDGYLAAFRFALPYERGEADIKSVDKIIFTSDYGQPYIYALFVRETNPIEYHGGSLIKYEFKEEVTVGDLERENVLVVASDTDELFGENDRADHVIYGTDGSVRFRMYIRR